MDDLGIVELYFERSERAIEESDRKYGKYCRYIASNILFSDEDAKECVDDTYLRAWNSIPPTRPTRLGAFLGRITRNIALNRYNMATAKKRLAGTELIFEEAEEMIPSPESERPLADDIALKDAINGFLSSLLPPIRRIFVRRYFYMGSLKEIAAETGLTVGNVKVILTRTRKRLRAHLEKEGISI